MNQTLIIAKRELSALFYSPVAYLVLGIFAFVASLLFLATFSPGSPASLRIELGWIVWLMAFIVPAISMRLVSEEMSSGTVELLMTAPVDDAQLILGKWLGALAFFLILLIPLLIHVLVLELNGSPDYGPIFTGLLGVVLVGALYLAIGTFASTISNSQLIAFMLTVLITGFLTIGMYMIGSSTWLPANLKPVVFYLNVDQQFSDFGKGLIDIRNFVYFFSGIALFLFFAVKLLESRRWR